MVGAHNGHTFPNSDHNTTTINCCCCGTVNNNKKKKVLLLLLLFTLAQQRQFKVVLLWSEFGKCGPCVPPYNPGPVECRPVRITQVNMSINCRTLSSTGTVLSHVVQYRASDDLNDRTGVGTTVTLQGQTLSPPLSCCCKLPH